MTCIFYTCMYASAKTDVIEDSVIKTPVAGRVDFSPTDFRKNDAKNDVYTYVLYIYTYIYASNTFIILCHEIYVPKRWWTYT